MKRTEILRIGQNFTKYSRRNFAIEKLYSRVRIKYIFASNGLSVSASGALLAKVHAKSAECAPGDNRYKTRIMNLVLRWRSPGSWPVRHNQHSRSIYSSRKSVFRATDFSLYTYSSDSPDPEER